MLQTCVDIDLSGKAEEKEEELPELDKDLTDWFWILCHSKSSVETC